MELLFSLPVHEKPEVVIDQIINFQHFNPGAGIILHISQAFDFSKCVMDRETFISEITSLGNVFVNPVSLRTGLQDMIQAHISNYRYMRSICDFDKFCLCASNDMFFRTGLAEHIRPYDCGEAPRLIAPVEGIDDSQLFRYYYTEKVLRDEYLKNALEKMGTDKIWFSHIEGSYYSAELFGELADQIEQFYDYRKMEMKYPREEVYFSTCYMNSDKKDRYSLCPDGVFTFVPWERDGFWVWESDLKRLAKEPGGYFCVKRVARELNVYLRKYLRKKYGYEQKEIEILGKIVDTKGVFRSKWKDETKQKIKSHFSKH